MIRVENRKRTCKNKTTWFRPTEFQALWGLKLSEINFLLFIFPLSRSKNSGTRGKKYHPSSRYFRMRKIQYFWPDNYRYSPHLKSYTAIKAAKVLEKSQRRCGLTELRDKKTLNRLIGQAEILHNRGMALQRGSIPPIIMRLHWGGSPHWTQILSHRNWGFFVIGWCRIKEGSGDPWGGSTGINGIRVHGWCTSVVL